MILTREPLDRPPLRLIAACSFGLEAVVRRELHTLGIEAEVDGDGQVIFEGDWDTVVRANLWLRCADRVLVCVARFTAPDFDTLFEKTRGLNWGEWIPVDGRFPVTGRSVRSELSSVPACQRTVKRAIVDALRRDHQANDLVETAATYEVNVSLIKDIATLTIDTSGASLHRRGYRRDPSRGPLKETLAAATVLLSHWESGRPFCDPFCGTGTIPIEAAWIARNIAPGVMRSFALEDWPAIPNDLRGDLRRDAVTLQTPSVSPTLLATDINPKVLRAARDNAVRAGVEADIHFEAKAFSEFTSRRRFGCLITHPPEGNPSAGSGSRYPVSRGGRTPRPTKSDHRSSADRSARVTRELDALFEAFPDVFRRLPTWSHFLLTAYPGLERLLGRKADRRRKLYNGNVACTLFQFHGPKPVVEVRQAGADAEQPSSDPTSTPSAGNVDGTTNESSKPAGKAPEIQASESQTLVHASGGAAFGQLPEKAHHQADLFASRLAKRARHLRRWPTKRGITCYRLYEKDVPEIPLVVDRYEDCLHITEYERPHDRDPAQHANWLDLMVETAAKTLDVAPENAFLKSRRRQRGKTQHEKQAVQGRRLVVQEDGLKFLVNLSDYVDTGLFLDHRVTRHMVRQQADGTRFLNLFAYTGSFSVYAAAGGAKSTTSVDLSNTYTDWATENLRLNGFESDNHRVITSDVAEFLANHPAGQCYDLVVVDPPTFSNSKRTENVWDVQRDALPLLETVIPLVRPGGVIYFSTNFRRFKFDQDALDVQSVIEISRQTVPEDYRNRRIHRCWRIVR